MEQKCRSLFLLGEQRADKARDHQRPSGIASRSRVEHAPGKGAVRAPALQGQIYEDRVTFPRPRVGLCLVDRPHRSALQSTIEKVTRAP